MLHQDCWAIAEEERAEHQATARWPRGSRDRKTSLQDQPPARPPGLVGGERRGVLLLKFLPLLLWKTLTWSEAGLRLLPAGF